MEEYSFLINLENKNNKEKKKISKKKDNNIPKKKISLKSEILNHYNSDTDFIIDSEKERRKTIRQYLRKKNKLPSNKDNSRKKYYAFKKGYNLKKIIKKDKGELSDLIEGNSQKVKLFGNPRYNKNNPSLFVEDLKNRIPSNKMGLVPLPSKKKGITDGYKEPQDLYDMQRNLAMVRRYQYDKKYNNKLKEMKINKNGKDDEYYMLQKWWKKIPKINLIQRVYRGYLIRKQVGPILQLYRFMKKFDNFLKNLILKRNIIIIKNFSALRRRKIIENCLITKKREYISTKLYKDIRMIENNFRCYRAKIKRNFLQRGKNGRIINHASFFTKKIYVEQNQTDNNILMMQNNIKVFLKNLKYIDCNLIHRNKGTYYFDKVYINKKNKTLIDFVKLLTHGLQLWVFKKRIFFKKLDEYDEDDINKVKFIQKNYLKHYYDNLENIPKIYNKKDICFIDKLRKNPIDKKVELIQDNVRKFLSNKSNYQNSIIRRQQILGDQINKNNLNDCNMSLNNNFNYDVNNNICYITKINIKNVDDLLLKAQKVVQKYVKKRIERKKINKEFIHINSLFIKEYSNQGKCMKFITKLQNLYKNQYKYNKDNIINYEDFTDIDSSFDDFSARNHKTLRKLKYKNRVPKGMYNGLYISKIRISQKETEENRVYSINYNRNINISYRKEGLIITKIRIRNYDENIKKIQKKFKNHQKNLMDEIFTIQKPMTDNYNFYSVSSSSYDDMIYSKKLNNYYYLSKITKININDKIKKIQNNFLRHYSQKKNENEALNKGKILMNQKRKHGLGFIATKIRYGPLCNISGNAKKNIVIPQKNLCYISKITYLDNKNKIMLIQKFVKDKIINNDKIISRKDLFNNNNKSEDEKEDGDKTKSKNSNLFKNEIKDKNVNDNNSNKKGDSYIDNKYNNISIYYSKNFKNNKNDILRNNSSINKSKNQNNKDKANSLQRKNNIKSLGLYLSKEYFKKIYKKEKIKNCLITKIIKNPENFRQINTKLLLLTTLFITKNIQEYIFNLLKNRQEDFEYPFYLSTLNRVIKYLQSTNYKGKNVKFVFEKIFSDLNSDNYAKKDLILLLTPERENHLCNVNIYNNIEQDFLNYIHGFSIFDKKLKNEKFLNVRLNNSIFQNTNIFTITKFIDTEFDNLINGKYCYKCYLDLDACKCFKSNEELTDEALDIGLNDDYNPKNSIKYFEYDNNKSRGTLIKGKPKIDNKDNIITKSYFNQSNELKSKNNNSNNNSLMNSKRNVEYLRYYDKNNNNNSNTILLRDDNY